nr:helix-turn-helix transcriptional regulator [Armatimonas sp.]
MISSVIQEARQCQGLTLGALANKVGINKSTLSRWETGKTRPCAPELARVLEILDIPETMCRQCFQQVGTPRTDRYLVRDAAEQARLPVSGGELLRALRVRASYSQADAARRVAVTQSLLSRWENNGCWPGEEKLLRLCNTLGATPNEAIGLRDYAWRNQDELPNDKEDLDRIVQGLNNQDTLLDRDLLYLALGSRYATLYRQNQIGEADATGIWGAYAYHLYGTARTHQARRIAAPALQTIERTWTPLSWAQTRALLTITDSLSQHQKYDQGIETLLRFESRFPASLRHQWANTIGMLFWHRSKLNGSQTCLKRSDGYFEESAKVAPCPQTERVQRQRYARVLSEQGRFEESLTHFQRTPTSELEPRVYVRAEKEFFVAKVLAGLGEIPAARTQLLVASNLLADYPTFRGRGEYVLLEAELTAQLR